jgi:hypothetical protein
VNKYTYTTIKELGLDKTLDLRNTKLKSSFYLKIDENNTIYRVLKRHGRLLENIILEFKEINDTHIMLLQENIKTININGCHKVSDKGILHIANNCHNLVKLELYWMPTLSDTALNAILSNCTLIQSLNLSGCKGFTKSSLTNLSGLKNLQEIDLTRCTGLTDDVVTDLVQLKRLRKLNLYALPYLKCDFMYKMKCNLELLDLCGNAEVTDKHFIDNVEKLGNLTYLNLVNIYALI